AVIMLIASLKMIFSENKEPTEQKNIQFKDYVMTFLIGAVVGSITGIVGIGGGFLIVPALAILGNLPVRKAVGTSLFIISINALIGFLGGDVFNYDINWKFLVTFTILSIGGIFIGSYINKKFSAQIIKKWFGWFVLLMSVIILIKEIIQI
ncbi:MAG: sulfite exporter TauE/SafE family protein, partial [Flavobacteriales bacterium]